MKAILIIDMQNGFMKATNAYLVRSIQRLTNKIKFEKAFYTQFINAQNSSFAQFLNMQDMSEGEKTEFAVPLLPHAVVWQKQTYGLTHDQILQLKTENVSKIYLCGTDIDAGILAIAFQLFDAQIQPVFIIDCCDTSSGQFSIKELAITIIKRQFGKDSIVTSTELAKGKS